MPSSVPKFAKAEISHIKRELSPLLGFKVKEIDAVYVDMNVWPCMILERDGKEYLLQAVRDPEVNGPGTFLFKEC